jgi:hypothetical protein
MYRVLPGRVVHACNRLMGRLRDYGHVEFVSEYGFVQYGHICVECRASDRNGQYVQWGRCIQPADRFLECE